MIIKYLKIELRLVDRKYIYTHCLKYMYYDFRVREIILNEKRNIFQRGIRTNARFLPKLYTRMSRNFAKSPDQFLIHLR